MERKVFKKNDFKDFLKEILPVTDHRGWAWEVWESILDKEWAMELDITAILFKKAHTFAEVVDLAERFTMLAEEDVAERLDHLVESKCAEKQGDLYQLTESCRLEFSEFYQKNKEILDKYYGERIE